MMNKKRLFGAVAGGMLLASLAAGPAGAVSNQGGCPDGGGWFLFPATLLIEDLDNGNMHDQTDDGRVCGKVNKGQTEKHGRTSFTVKDNTNPLP